MEPIKTPSRSGWHDYRAYGKPVLAPMEKPAPVEKPEIKVDEVKLSKNIERYDRKVQRVKTVRPYDYNSISLNKVERIATPTETILDPTLNTVGKFLGVDTHHDWAKYSDKLQVIVNWAKDKSKTDDTEKVLRWLDTASNNVPSFGMSHRKIDQLYLYAKLQMSK